MFLCTQSRLLAWLRGAFAAYLMYRMPDWACGDGGSPQWEFTPWPLGTRTLGDAPDDASLLFLAIGMCGLWGSLGVRELFGLPLARWLLKPAWREGLRAWAGEASAMLAALPRLLVPLDADRPPPPPKDEHRGTRLVEPQAARVRATLARLRHGRGAGGCSAGRATVRWAGLDLPEELAAGHLCAVGAPKSGKTVTIRLVMQSVLPHVGSRDDFRAVVYDAKEDVYGLLVGMGLDPDRLRVLNPFDARCCTWAIAEDVTTPAMAEAVAEVLIPEAGSGVDRFFTEAARNLLSGAMTVLMHCAPGRWTLRDVLNLLQDDKRLAAALRSLHATRSIAENYFNPSDPRLTANVQATVGTLIRRFRTIAALWSARPSASGDGDVGGTGGPPLSLRRWAEEQNTILILGNKESYRPSIDAFNQLFVHLLTNFLLDDPREYDRGRVWFFLDELKEAGKLNGLARLLTKGRTKGVRVMLGFQDISGLQAVYGAETAAEIPAMCAYKALLRMDSAETARWASQLVGEYERKERTQTRGRRRGWKSRLLDPRGVFDVLRPVDVSYSEQRVRREAVIPSEFLRMPAAEGPRFHGVYLTPSVGNFKKTVDASSDLSPAAPPDVAPNFVPRDTRDQLLTPWDPADLRRLNFSSGSRRSSAANEDDVATSERRVRDRRARTERTSRRPGGAAGNGNGHANGNRDRNRGADDDDHGDDGLFDRVRLDPL